MGRKKIVISDNELKKLYWEDGLSGKEIATILGCSPAAVSMRMSAAGIKTRHARKIRQ